MKIKNKKLGKRNAAVGTIIRADEVYEFIVTALPRGFMDKFIYLGVTHAGDPPSVFKRDSKTGAYVVGPDGQAEEKLNYNDPVFKEKAQKCVDRAEAIQLWKMLSDDKAVDIETAVPKEDTKENWDKFADGVIAELAEADFTQRELNYLIELGQNIECINTEKAATEGFLYRPESSGNNTESKDPS